MLLNRIRIVAFSATMFAACVLWTALAFPQDGTASQTRDDPGAPAADARPQPGYPDHVRPQAHYPHQRRSVVHHYPYPYPEYYHGDSQGGFRNPGGRGRYAEYYPAGERFQNAQDPVRAARFDRGGGAPDRSEQLAAYNAGTSRYNSIQNSIDNYARPYMGLGFGVGGFGGFW